MAGPTLIYLPGLHGTEALTERFLRVVPAEIPRRVIGYPRDVPLSYEQLLPLISEPLENQQEMVVIGESFAGPLALMYAAANPSRIAGVVLCATFARHPLPAWLGRFSSPLPWRLPLPASLIRYFAAGADASDAFVDELRLAIRQASPPVLAKRLQCTLTVDCTDALKRCPSPIIYLAARKDHLVGRHCQEYICAMRSDVEVVNMDAPHLILQTAPQEAWVAMSRFWDDAGQRAR